FFLTHAHPPISTPFPYTTLFRSQRRQYRWVDRRGQLLKSLDVDAGLFQHQLSPDEKHFIADQTDPQTGTYDLWIYDVSGSNPQRFTFNPANDFNPVWSPDGGRIVWASTRDGVQNLYQKAVTGAEGQKAGRGAEEESLLLK